MADSTSTLLTEPTGLMEYDHVVLTLTDGETYITRLSKPYGALLTEANSDSTSGTTVNLDYALNDRTFTIRYKAGNVAVTDKKVAMLVYGRK